MKCVAPCSSIVTTGEHTIMIYNNEVGMGAGVSYSMV